MGIQMDTNERLGPLDSYNPLIEHGMLEEKTII